MTSRTERQIVGGSFDYHDRDHQQQHRQSSRGVAGTFLSPYRCFGTAAHPREGDGYEDRQPRREQGRQPRILSRSVARERSRMRRFLGVFQGSLRVGGWSQNTEERQMPRILTGVTKENCQEVEWGADLNSADVCTILETYNVNLYERCRATGCDLPKNHEMGYVLGHGTRNRPRRGGARASHLRPVYEERVAYSHDHPARRTKLDHHVVDDPERSSTQRGPRIAFTKSAARGSESETLRHSSLGTSDGRRNAGPVCSWPCIPKRVTIGRPFDTGVLTKARLEAQNPRL